MEQANNTFGRIFVMAAFALSCFSLLLFLWLAFGGPIPFKPKGYRFTTSFGEATQLAQEADVRISGVAVGKVKLINLGPDGRTDAQIELKSQYAPLARDTRAILRQKTLLGETYVELTPGHKRPGNMLPEDGRLPSGQVSPTVELDEIFRTFDPRTRRAFQQAMEGQALALRGRGQDINDAIGNLAPFAEDSSDLLTVLNSQSGAVRGTVKNTGTVLNALTARDHQLRSLIVNSNRVFKTTADRNRELKATFQALPTFQREGRTTIDRLTRFANTTNPLVNQLRPAARELSPTFRQLQLLAPDLKGLFLDLRPAIDAGNRGLPSLRRFLAEFRPVLGQLDPFLREVNPFLEYIGRYKRELNTFFANAATSTEATDRPPGSKVPVHYLRLTSPLNLESLAAYPRRLGSNRTTAYALPNAFDRLPQGLQSYETRHCGRPLPLLANLSQLTPSQILNLLGNIATQTAGSTPVVAPVAGVIAGLTSAVASNPAITQTGDQLAANAQQFLDRIQQFIVGSGVGLNTAAPPCVQQAKQASVGKVKETTQAPHVYQDARPKPRP